MRSLSLASLLLAASSLALLLFFMRVAAAQDVRPSTRLRQPREGVGSVLRLSRAAGAPSSVRRGLQRIADERAVMPRGASLGLDVQLFSRCEEAGTPLVLTLGLKRLYTGPLRRHEAVASSDGTIVLRTERAPVSAWTSFLVATLAF